MTITSIFSLIFVLILIFLITSRYHRSVAALLGALLMILFGLEYGLFTVQNFWSELVGLIDMNVVLLVIGVMILSQAVARTGLFEFIGLSLAKRVGGSFRKISVMFMLLTIVFSMLLTNITSMVIMGALIISLAKKFKADPTETVVYAAVVTNIGGLMLMISSIPNLIVAAQLNIGFVEFAVISIPLALMISLVSIIFIFRKIGKRESAEVRIEADPWSVVKSKSLFYKAAIVFICVVILFTLEDFIKIPRGLIAISGAIAMLILGGQEPESIFSDVDWGTIFFLISFYVIVGGLEKSGVLATFAEDVTQVLSFQPGLTSVFNVWICGLSSSMIDNIPITLTLIPVMQHISTVTGFSLQMLGWGIVFGANLGGILTPIGAPSNIIALGILKKEGKSVGWGEWLRLCGPLVVLQLILASIYVTFLSVIL